MAKKPQPQWTGPMRVNIAVLNDGMVSLVFSHDLKQFTASAEEMTQLGVNLIKASTVAQQHREQLMPQYSNAVTTTLPARKM